MSKIKQKPHKKPGDGGGYPYNSLSACLKLATVIKDHGGGEVPKAVIAETLAMGDTSPSFYQICASTKCFGIVEGTRALKLTDLGHDYFFPTTESSSRAASLAFVNTPPVFASLIERFDGKRIPNAGLIANLIQRESGVPPSWSARAAGLFLNTLSELNLLDPGGFLRYGANLHQANRPTVDEGSTNEQRVPVARLETPPEPVHPEAVGAMRSQTSAALRTPTTESALNVWQFTEAGGTIRLETPDPLPPALWIRLKRYVEILKPEDSKGEGP
jgi:hypothetical protein